MDESLTPLMQAAKENDIEKINECLEQRGNADGGQSDLTKQDRFGETALMKAILNGHVEPVMLLAEYECGYTDKEGKNALIHAVEKNNLEAVKLLLGYVSERNYAKEDGTTALITAAEYGRAECVELLRGYQAGRQNRYGWTALMLAASHGYSACVDLLIHEAGKRTAEASHWGSKYPIGATALIIAVICRRLDIVLRLLPYEFGIPDSNGHTALWHARYHQLREIEQILMVEASIPPNFHRLVAPDHSQFVPGELDWLRRYIHALGHVVVQRVDTDEIGELEARLEESESNQMSLLREVCRYRDKYGPLDESG
ncbi:Ankyrin repeat protein 1 [Giardia muris]|uniref:Ankyrin repeat protein 1 n=1 Tax=Giardia muris TaxID=5742 RepID=A0A4Z1SMG4_GIAMU|nr:Ankyrin repeat protein 1 [Giardia muris]|eukprot:TNJ26882.1 Ankyrin repeat protein 1 [Giardia muris]